MFSEELYNKIALNKSVSERFASGYWSDVHLSLPGRVQKTTNNSFGLEKEYSFMVTLWNTGFRDMPKPIELKNDGDTIVMEEIFYGTPFEEVFDLAQRKELPKFLVRHLLDLLSGVLENFWELGFSHNDLHGRNVLVGIDQQGKWRVWLIDFGTSELGGDQTKDKENVKSHFGIDV